MIQQPTLGKKIAEFRKAKGLTQEELVEKCNLNVRTLQRIEAGEVTPRTSTIKLIFDALEMDLEAIAEEISKEAQATSKTSEFGFWELFNFKTHPMKKLLIFFFPLLSIALMFIVIATRQRTFDDSKVQRSDITRASTLFDKYFNAGQLDSLGILFTKDATFMPAGEPMLRGRDAIVDYYEAVYNSGFRIIPGTPDFVTISDSIAIERGVWVGRNNGTFTGNYLTQWRLVNGNWYIENTVSHQEE